MPHFSIVVTAYNSSKTLEECLKAIRLSTYRDYELIVVNDGSCDDSGDIAKRYADRVIEHPQNLGLHRALASGFHAMTGQIFVNIDSDIEVCPSTIEVMANFFCEHPEFSALTGCLSKESSDKGFFSQYKNLYMHYIFSRLPEEVTFLYGSLFAVRREDYFLDKERVRIANDTELGQGLVREGKRVAFLRDLQVIHFKKHNFTSFIMNDFQVPFYWVRVFMKYEGWKELLVHNGRFAHAPSWQLASLPLACLIVILILFFHLPSFSFFLFLGWFLLNSRFLLFLFKEKGTVFALFSLLVTFMDNLVMAAGVVSGFVVYLFR